jgi:hypothetical protein
MTVEPGDLSVDAIIVKLETVIKELRVAQAKDEADDSSEEKSEPANLKDAAAATRSVIRASRKAGKQ